MISKDDIRLYKSIQAPDSLKEKVPAQAKEAQPKNTRRHFAGAALIAACLALVPVSLFPFGNPVLRFEGQVIGASPVSVTEAAQYSIRTASLAPTVIELELSQDAEVSASAGETEFVDETLIWTLPPEVTEATLSVTKKEKTTLYFLHADADGAWYMEKK